MAREAFSPPAVINNQVTFCAPCMQCQERKVKGVYYKNRLLTADGGEPLAGVEPNGPSTPPIPFTTINRCGCKDSDKVYVNVQTRHAVFPGQYAGIALFLSLEYECQGAH